MDRGQIDLTQGSIQKQMVLFAIPIFLGNLFQQLYNTVDSIIVGNYLGEQALAAVASSGTMIFFIVGFFNGVSIGAGVVISRHFGAKDEERLRKSIHTAVALGLIASVLLTLIGVFCTPFLLKLIAVPEEVMPNSVAYFRIYFAGSLGLVMYNIFVGIMQALGDSRHPLYYLMFSSAVNVVLDLLFVAVFDMGVSGAALATIISQLASAILCMYRLMYRSTVALKVREIRLDKEQLREILRVGLPSGMQNSIISLANIFVQYNINGFGMAAMAGVGSYSKLEGFAFLPVTAFSMAISTFVSQNLGAQKQDRVRKGALFGIGCGVLMAEIIGVVFNLNAPWCIQLFNDEAEVIGYGVRMARTTSLFYGVLAYSHCVAGVLRGAGRSTVPMLVMLVCWCVIRITYLIIATRLFPVIESVFWAYPITWSLSFIVFTVYMIRSDILRPKRA